MKVLLTGTAGSIGSFLLEGLLEKGYEVIGIDDFSYSKKENIEHNFSNEKFTFIEKDLTTLDYSLLPCFDCVLHLAALKKIGDKSTWKRSDLLVNNSLITQKLLKISADRGAKFIFASTSDVYGASEELPFREDGTPTSGPSYIGRWDYSVTKLFEEHLCFSYAEDYNMDVVVMRFFGTYNERTSSQFGGHLPIFIRKAIEKKPITIHGDGLHTRSMCDIYDLVNGTIRCIENEKANGQIINIGNDEEITILDQAKLVWKLVNGEEEPKFIFIPLLKLFGGYKEIMRRVPDLAKARKLLDYEPIICFKDGLKRVIKKIRENEYDQ